MTIIKKVITSIGEERDKLKPSSTVDGNLKAYSHFGKQFRSPSKMLNI